MARHLTDSFVTFPADEAALLRLANINGRNRFGSDYVDFSEITLIDDYPQGIPPGSAYEARGEASMHMPHNTLVAVSYKDRRDGRCYVLVAYDILTD